MQKAHPEEGMTTVKHRKTCSRGRVKKYVTSEHSVEFQGEFASGYTIYHSICRLNKATMVSDDPG